MPSPIGHALGGVAAVWLVDLIPGRRAWRTASPSASWLDRAGDGLTVACAMLAVTPDLDLVFRTHRTVTHSLVAAAFMGLMGAVLAARIGRPLLRVACMSAAAYGSHLLFDWLAADRYPPYGFQLLWPFSQTWFISGWDFFAQTERRDLVTLPVIKQNAIAIAREIEILGPIIAALWLVRVKALAGLAAKLPGRHHSPQ